MKKFTFFFTKALLSQFLKTNIVQALTESGIVSSRGFVQELMRKMKHKLLPELQAPDNFLFVINKIFHKSRIISGWKEWIIIYGNSFLKCWVSRSILQSLH